MPVLASAPVLQAWDIDIGFKRIRPRHEAAVAAKVRRDIEVRATVAGTRVGLVPRREARDCRTVCCWCSVGFADDRTRGYGIDEAAGRQQQRKAVWEVHLLQLLQLRFPGATLRT